MNKKDDIRSYLEELEVEQNKIDEFLLLMEENAKSSITPIFDSNLVLEPYGKDWREKAKDIARKISERLDKNSY